VAHSIIGAIARPPPGWGTEPHEAPGLQFARWVEVCTPDATEGTSPVLRTRERRSCSSIHALSGDLKRAISRTSQQPARRTAAPAKPSHRGQRRHPPLVAAAERGMSGRAGRRRDTGARSCPSVQSTNKAHNLYDPLDTLDEGHAAGLISRRAPRRGVADRCSPSCCPPLALSFCPSAPAENLKNARTNTLKRGLQQRRGLQSSRVSWSGGCAPAPCLGVAQFRDAYSTPLRQSSFRGS